MSVLKISSVILVVGIKMLDLVNISETLSTGASAASKDPHGQVSSFLKFSIQNILQQAAASSGATAAAAAVAAAATRRSNDLMQSDMAAAVMSEFDMKRAASTLPFW